MLSHKIGSTNTKCNKYYVQFFLVPDCIPEDLMSLLSLLTCKPITTPLDLLEDV